MGLGGVMSLVGAGGVDVVGGDAEGRVCRVGGGGGGGVVVVAVLAWRRRSMRLRVTWARHLCRTNKSIFEYLNINSCFFEKSRTWQTNVKGSSCSVLVRASNCHPDISP
jgi:hypothetical protein